jgi:uncharacterized membrane protein
LEGEQKHTQLTRKNNHLATTLSFFFAASPFYSPFYARPSGVVVSTGPSFGGLFLVVGFFLVASAVLSNAGNLGGSGPAGSSAAARSVLGPGTSVIELSVALDVPDRDDPNSILSALDRLSRTAKTDSRVGVQNLTSQVALELLRRKSSIVAACAKGRHFGDAGGAQREYNGATVRERGKFQRETISRYGGVDYSSEKKKLKSSTSSDDYYSADATVAVITIVVLIDGDTTSGAMPSRMNSVRDVESALSRIASDARVDDCLRGAEILWTPEERDETLTMREVLADYPSLRSI